MPRLRDIRCLRMTPAGVVTIDFRLEGKEVDFWLEYNQRYRNDNILAVEAEIRHPGLFGSPEAAEAALKARWGNLCR